MNNPKLNKRRYFLNKSKKTQAKANMDREEVATDYKLKQFLADVEKFSGKTKIHKEDKTSSKQPVVPRKSLPEKRGLFENGMLSKPSVKEILGPKNEARLVGNLENLLKDDDDPKLPFDGPSTSASYVEIQDSTFQRDAVCSTSKEKERKETLDDFTEFLEESAKFFKQDLQNEIMQAMKKKYELLLKSESTEDEHELDEAIQFTYNKLNEYEKKTRENAKEMYDKLYPNSNPAMFLHEKLYAQLEKSITERILQNDPSLMKDIKNVLDEYFQSKRVDKCVQTDYSFGVVEDNNVKEKSNVESNAKNSENKNKLENVMFTPVQKQSNFVLPIPTTGQPQGKFVHETPCSPQQKKFFGFLAESVPEPKRKKIEDNFEFISRKNAKHRPFLTPPKLSTSPLFGGTLTPELRPPFEDSCWAPTMKKPYFPAILSPPSPGRKYSDSPTFLQEAQWSNIKKPYKGAPKAFNLNLKEGEHPFVNLKPLGSEDLWTPSTSRDLPFPKRLRMTYSPHRL